MERSASKQKGRRTRTNATRRRFFVLNSSARVADPFFYCLVFVLGGRNGLHGTLGDVIVPQLPSTNRGKTQTCDLLMRERLPFPSNHHSLLYFRHNLNFSILITLSYLRNGIIFYSLTLDVRRGLWKRKEEGSRRLFLLSSRSSKEGEQPLWLWGDLKK